MCGIVGYIGNQSSKKILLNGLKKLEYRGYDSCGIATILDKNFKIQKSTKRVTDLEKITNETSFSHIGIGHTRWATHGIPSENNAHPHVDCKNKFAVVHNGIIENYLELKNKLLKEGFTFYSETDTEVIPNLISYYFTGDVKQAIQKAMQEIKGSFALSIMFRENTEVLYVARRKSPLLIGVNGNEKIIASDFCAIVDYTNQVYLLENDEIAEITKEYVNIYDENLQVVEREITRIEMGEQDLELGTFQHYMQKEIYENPIAVRKTLEKYFDENRQIQLGLPEHFWQNINRITIVACGTAMHAGLTAKYNLEELVGVPVQVEVASEFKYKRFLLNENDLVILISQSGETADTLAAQELIKLHGIKHIAIVNVPNSTLARVSDFVLYTQAGVEVAVASTKAYIAQVTLLNILALEIAKKKKVICEEKEKQFVDELFSIPTDIETILEDEESYKMYAKEIRDKKSIFFIGRGMDYYAVLEGSLKLKEISYIHSEAYQAGELKHGTIALIEKGTKVVAVCTNEELAEKTMSNIKEVVSRGAEVVLITNLINPKKETKRNESSYDEKDLFVKEEQTLENIFEKIIRIPKTSHYFSPLLSVIPMQLIAYYTTVEKGFDVDKPRNLAKSVTVE